jgi:hypothetical protein
MSPLSFPMKGLNVCEVYGQPWVLSPVKRSTFTSTTCLGAVDASGTNGNQLRHGSSLGRITISSWFHSAHQASKIDGIRLTAHYVLLG